MANSYLWRSIVAVGGLGLRVNADSEIEFTPSNVTDGKHIHQHEIAGLVGFSENEKPKGAGNEFQDTGFDSFTFTVTGTTENPGLNAAEQTVKEWLIEDKTNGVFTKGRFGIELEDFSKYNVVPAAAGLVPDQPRGLILVSWQWIRNGEFRGKADFVAVFKLNGDLGNTTTTPSYDWEGLHT